MRTSLAAMLAVTLLPATALAHGTLPGTGGFAAGLLHPLLATEQAILLVSLGLLSGAVRALEPAAGLTLGLVAGLTLTPVFPGPDVQTLTALALGLAGLAGVLAALGEPERHPLRRLSAGALVAGLIVGLGTDLPQAQGSGSGLQGALAAAVGAVTGALLLMLNAAAFARSPMAVGPGRRIAGSWVAAAAVLMLAFSLQAVQANP